MKAYREIVVISGKGGTGKTSITASILPFLSDTVIADCDVDAPDLHILLEPSTRSVVEFRGGNKASIDPDLCAGCGDCVSACHFDALSMEGDCPHVSIPDCEGCGACLIVCENQNPGEPAIRLAPAVTGVLCESETPYGVLVHAQLVPGEEASGKLVAAVRARARKLAEESGARHILIDGPPGIACNAISAASGADLALVVTEPGSSGHHDLLRLLGLTDALGVPAAIVINKSGGDDAHERQVRDTAAKQRIPVLMSIPLDRRMPACINRREIPSLGCAELFAPHHWATLIDCLRHPGDGDQEERNAR